MHHVIPAARGLRTLYALTSDRVLFGLAVIACLLLAAEVVDLAWTQSTPRFDGFFGY